MPVWQQFTDACTPTFDTQPQPFCPLSSQVGLCSDRSKVLFVPHAAFPSGRLPSNPCTAPPYETAAPPEILNADAQPGQERILALGSALLERLVPRLAAC